jgi:hypothetical protein
MSKPKLESRWHFRWPVFPSNGSSASFPVPGRTTYTVGRAEGGRAHITWANGSRDFFGVGCPIALGSREIA